MNELTISVFQVVATTAVHVLRPGHVALLDVTFAYVALSRILRSSISELLFLKIESKELSKMHAMISNCMQGIKMEFNQFNQVNQ